MCSKHPPEPQRGRTGLGARSRPPDPAGRQNPSGAKALLRTPGRAPGGIPRRPHRTKAANPGHRRIRTHVPVAPHLPGRPGVLICDPAVVLEPDGRAILAWFLDGFWSMSRSHVSAMRMA